MENQVPLRGQGKTPITWQIPDWGRTLSPSQERIASDTFAQRMIEHPHSELLEDILVNPDMHSDAENCWAIIEVSWIAIKEPGIIGDWLIIWLLSSF